ncbi:MAG: hypothetical protein KDH84_05875, partial [Calditrichaeota bacterium]|nr:hypothetical protein [Calditrichota bacterium]
QTEEKKGGPKPPNPLKAIWSLLNSFKSISLDYKDDATYGDFNLREVPGWEYQFGFNTGDPNQGNPDLSFDKVAIARSIRKTRSLDGSTQLDLFRNMKIGLKYNR